MTMLLNSSSPDAFLERVAAARHDGPARRPGADPVPRRGGQTHTRPRPAIDAEIKEQQKQVTVLAKKKKDAELALASVGGGAVAGGFINANSPLAKPAPRNSDGSWPKESCTINDPTTGGCITPAHAARATSRPRSAGFKRYTSCFSQRSVRRAPEGPRLRLRRRDRAASRTSTPPAATSTYGNNLAAYFVKNADRLGVHVRDLVPADLDARHRLAVVQRLAAARRRRTPTTCTCPFV